MCKAIILGDACLTWLSSSVIEKESKISQANKKKIDRLLHE